MTTNSKDMTKDLQTISPESKITKKDFNQCFWRSLTLDSSWNYERMQNIAYCYMMAPIIRRLYENKEDRAAALKRHLEFMSVTPHISTLLVGISGAMEEENAKNPDFDENSINAVKSSLMGPMAGVGDSFFWGTLLLIAAGVGVSLASQGNIMGPILFFLIINIPHFILRYLCLDKGFVGINGIDREFGFSTSSFNEAEIKKVFMESARETYVLADHTKFDKKYMVKVIGLEDGGRHIITNRKYGYDYSEWEEKIDMIYAE